MVFALHVRKYKVSIKYVKNAGQDVYSLGFPVAEVDKGKLSLKFISDKIDAKVYHEANANITFQLKNTQLKNDYDEWKRTVDHKNTTVLKEPSENYNTHSHEIVDRIKKYDLANSTPMQGLSFIQQLKFEILKVEEKNGNI